MANKRRGRRHRRTGNWFTRLSIGKKIALGISTVVVCLLVSGVVYVAAKFGKMDTKEIKKEDIIINDIAEEVGEGYTNIALFGGDSREGEVGEGVRTDTIIVASLNNATKEVKMVSVYRDTLMDLSKGRINKCNGAYSAGGPKQAINMLNMNLDLDIQKYVTVDFGAVAETIDLLGGIEVDVSEAEVEATNKYIWETAAAAGKPGALLTQAGLQKLNGVQATTYARIRKGVGDDYKRTERQRLVIQKMAEKALKSDLGTINRIIDKVFPRISTNFTMPEILSYAKDFAKYKIGDSQGFPFDKSAATLAGKGSCVIPVSLESNVQKLHEFLYGTIDYQPSAKVIKISNAIRSEAGNVQADPEPVNQDNVDLKKPEEPKNNNHGGNENNVAPGPEPTPPPTPQPTPDPEPGDEGTVTPTPDPEPEPSPGGEDVSDSGLME